MFKFYNFMKRTTTGMRICTKIVVTKVVKLVGGRRRSPTNGPKAIITTLPAVEVEPEGVYGVPLIFLHFQRGHQSMFGGKGRAENIPDGDSTPFLPSFHSNQQPKGRKGHNDEAICKLPVILPSTSLQFFPSFSTTSNFPKRSVFPLMKNDQWSKTLSRSSNKPHKFMNSYFNF
jgi:hypothetical protein